jgi:hypothetical protein
MATTGTIVVNGYTWTAAPAGCAFSAPNFSYSVLTFPGPGIYSITLTTATGTLISSITNTIQVGPPTLSVVTSNTLLCSGQTATLNASGANTYSWNGGPNTNSYVISPTLTTTYTLSGSTAVGCSVTTTFTQQVIVCQGLNEQFTQYSDVQLYPNPSREKVFIHSNKEWINDLRIEIVDLIGNTVLNTDHFELKDKLTGEIDISTLMSGVYLLHITTNNAHLIYKLIVED